MSSDQGNSECFLVESINPNSTENTMMEEINLSARNVQ